MESFQRRKSQTLAAISSPLPDKSPKGFLDAPIVSLIEAINLHPSFCTTSSCSGRISILCHPNPNPNANSSSKIKKKAGGGRWVFVTHDPADQDAVVDVLFGGGAQESGEGGGGWGDLVFRFEPLIIAVECADVEAAQALVSAAISCGFRESGITSIQKRIIIAIRCSIRLEVPLGQVGSIMVPQEYVRYLVGIANEKMDTNRKRTDCLLDGLPYKVLSGPAEQIDTNERNRGCLSDKGSFSHLEAKESDPLSETKLLEIDTLEHHNQDQVVDHVKDACDSGSGRHSSIVEKSTDSCYEDSLKDLNLLHELEVGYSNEEGTKTDSNPDLESEDETNPTPEDLTYF